VLAVRPPCLLELKSAWRQLDQASNESELHRTKHATMLDRDLLIEQRPGSGIEAAVTPGLQDERHGCAVLLSRA